MKTILVPTDFSAAAYNAIAYAAEIARFSGAKLILFHVYGIPVVTAEAAMYMSVDEVEEDARRELRKLKNRVVSAHAGDVMLIEYECRMGFPAEQIRFFAAECQADLIVMGMQGTDTLAGKLMGNITTSLMQKTSCPVLVIGKRVKFRGLKKIAFACDYSHMDTKRTLLPLKTLARLFHSGVYVLNVLPGPEELPSIRKAVEGIKLDHLLEGLEHTFCQITDANVLQGIQHFVETQDMDMVAMVPHRHSFLQRLFNEPHTKQMAFHTDIPLLVLHEQQKQSNAANDPLLTTPVNEDPDQR